MQIIFQSQDSIAFDKIEDTLVVFVPANSPADVSCAFLGAGVTEAINRAQHAARFEAKSGQCLEILAPLGLSAAKLVISAVDGDASGDLDHVTIGATICASLLASGTVKATLHDATDDIDMAAVAEGMVLRSYRFDKYRTKEPDNKKPTLTGAVLIGSDKTAASFDLRLARSEGVTLTKDLTSEPPNVLSPPEFAARIETLEAAGLKITVLGEAEMEELGMHSLLGVGQGSEAESKLAIMEWLGGDEGDAPYAIVGKGVTFDTGGISIKPSQGMEDMKWDMGGAGIVTGFMKSLAEQKVAKNVVGVVGLVENMPDGNAQRPGDVVTSMSGQTIEILNTDAEGRLVLADALWYTKETYNPRLIIDLATLTGAMIVALGSEYAGYFTNDDAIASALFDAGTDTGEKLWRFPLHKNYDKLIDTPTADVKNIGSRGAGSITAAQFLQRFVGDTPWAHLDVAGVVWSDKNLPLSEKGATGFGVRLLNRFLELVEK